MFRFRGPLASLVLVCMTVAVGWYGTGYFLDPPKRQKTGGQYRVTNTPERASPTVLVTADRAQYARPDPIFTSTTAKGARVRKRRHTHATRKGATKAVAKPNGSVEGTSPASTLIIAAVGRSGSTLLEHVASTLPNAFYLSEPWRQVTTQEDALLAKGAKRADVDARIDGYWKSIFDCSFTKSQASRDLFFYSHSCMMAEDWLTAMGTKAMYKRCRWGKLTEADGALIGSKCEKATIRVTKTIRFRGSTSSFPVGIPFKFLHLVRRPYEIVRSRYTLGWCKCYKPGDETQERHAKRFAILTSMFGTGSPDIATALCLACTGDGVCHQMMLTHASAASDIASEDQAHVRYEDIKGRPDAAVEVLYNLMNLPITPADQLRAAAVSNTSWVEFPKHDELISSLEGHPPAFWERVVLVLVAKCRAAYSTFGYRPLDSGPVEAQS